MSGVSTKQAFVTILFVVMLLGSACSLAPPQIIVITATSPAQSPITAPGITGSAESSVAVVIPTATAAPAQPITAPVDLSSYPTEHVVQAGDTLSGIAARYNVSLNALLAINTLDNPDLLVVGQVIALPEPPTEQTPDLPLLSDLRLIRSNSAAAFDVAQFVDRQPGYIRVASDAVTTRIANGGSFERTLTAAQVIDRVALEFSVDPRVLLALLEYRAGWLTNPTPDEGLQTHPLISEEDSGAIDRSGLYKQLSWAADQLNLGYYGRKYRSLQIIEFADGERVNVNPANNAATTGVHLLLSRHQAYNQWLFDVGAEGWLAAYNAFFGAAYDEVTATHTIPASQPDLALPFADGEIWLFTGGPHGGWGNGSAWSALDFAPPDDRPAGSPLCYTSEYWVRSVATGQIVRSGDGVVVLDLDGDGNEATGWSILYLHLADEGRIGEGQSVVTGDPIGRAACSGGFSTATHLHIARRYNGEWVPADCNACPPQYAVPSFVMSGWQAVSIPGQLYQGYLVRAGERVQAEQGRLTDVNRVSH